MSDKIIKQLYFCLGVLAMVLGFVGVFLPLMPTTCFLILAVWAFSRSRPEWAKWILHHPRFGSVISNWVEHRTIERKVKCRIMCSILLTFALTFLFISPSIEAGIVLLVVMLVLLHYINSLNEPEPEHDNNSALEITFPVKVVVGDDQKRRI